MLRSTLFAIAFAILSAISLGVAARSAAAQSTVGSGSYVRIDRPERERSFFKDGAAAWIGRRVHVHLPQSALEKAKEQPGGALEFRHRSVTVRIPARSPALARYNRRAPRGTILCLKGTVRRAKDGAHPILIAEDFRVGTLERW